MVNVICEWPLVLKRKADHKNIMETLYSGFTCLKQSLHYVEPNIAISHVLLWEMASLHLWQLILLRILRIWCIIQGYVWKFLRYVLLSMLSMKNSISSTVICSWIALFLVDSRWKQLKINFMLTSIFSSRVGLIWKWPFLVRNNDST